MRIGGLAKQLGIATSKIRFLESRDLVYSSRLPVDHPLRSRAGQTVKRPFALRIEGRNQCSFAYSAFAFFKVGISERFRYADNADASSRVI